MIKALIQRIMRHADRSPMWINVTHDQLVKARHWSNGTPDTLIIEAFERWSSANGGNYSRYRHMTGEPVDLVPPLRNQHGQLIKPERWEPE